MIVFKPIIFSSLNKETMTNSRKHKTKTKNGTYNNNNIFCMIVRGI